MSMEEQRKGFGYGNVCAPYLLPRKLSDIPYKQKSSLQGNETEPKK